MIVSTPCWFGSLYTMCIMHPLCVWQHVLIATSNFRKRQKGELSTSDRGKLSSLLAKLEEKQCATRVLFHPLSHFLFRKASEKCCLFASKDRKRQDIPTPCLFIHYSK
jgi:hypothetical protein